MQFPRNIPVEHELLERIIKTQGALTIGSDERFAMAAELLEARHALQAARRLADNELIYCWLAGSAGDDPPNAKHTELNTARRALDISLRNLNR